MNRVITKTDASAVVQPSEQDARVQPAHLARLDVLKELLVALNDSMVAAGRLAAYANKLPPLRARIIRRFAVRFPARALPSLTEQIAALGNRELEAILLGLLEDLTILRADLTG